MGEFNKLPAEDSVSNAAQSVQYFGMTRLTSLCEHLQKRSVLGGNTKLGGYVIPDKYDIPGSTTHYFHEDGTAYQPYKNSPRFSSIMVGTAGKHYTELAVSDPGAGEIPAGAALLKQFAERELKIPSDDKGLKYYKQYAKGNAFVSYEASPRLVTAVINMMNAMLEMKTFTQLQDSLDYEAVENLDKLWDLEKDKFPDSDKMITPRERIIIFARGMAEEAVNAGLEGLLLWPHLISPQVKPIVDYLVETPQQVKDKVIKIGGKDVRGTEALYERLTANENTENKLPSTAKAMAFKTYVKEHDPDLQRVEVETGESVESIKAKTNNALRCTVEGTETFDQFHQQRQKLVAEIEESQSDKMDLKMIHQDGSSPAQEKDALAKYVDSKLQKFGEDLALAAYEKEHELRTGKGRGLGRG